MNEEMILRSIGGVTATASLTTMLVFGNFLIRRGGGAVLGLNLPGEWLHLGLGVFLIGMTSMLVILTHTLAHMKISIELIDKAKDLQVWVIFGPLFNPFFISDSRFLSSIGYGFMIFVWWLGFHTFMYSVDLNAPVESSPLLYGWKILFMVLFLAAGLATMLGIQICWNQWGIDAYREKNLWSLVAIPLGAFAVPLLFRLGIPELLTSLKSGG